MKNISTKVLPARRTIGSIVRQTNQQKDRSGANGAESKTSGNINDSNHGSKIESDPVCDICAQAVPGPEREKIYASGKCDHHVCYVCSARLRAVCDLQECPICREKLDKVVFSANKTKSFDSHDLKSYPHDSKNNIYFENENIKSAFERLLSIECLKCLKQAEEPSSTSKEDDKKVSDQNHDPKTSPAAVGKTNKAHFPNIQRLKNHLDSVHKLRLCDLCLAHNKLFAFEYSYYDHESLKRHVQKGEPNTSHRGHPRCKLCNNIFFNLDELLQHMSREHYHCHLCGRHNSTQHIYFLDYPSLRNHFKTKHFLCERDNCRHEQFTSAFDTQVDYQLHIVQVHEISLNLTRGEARQHRTIVLDSASHRQVSNIQQDRLPSNAAIVTTGIPATANNPRRQIPESLQAQIIQQRLPSRADFPALGNTRPNTSSSVSQNSLHQSTSQQSRNTRDGAGPSFVRSLGGHGRLPEQLNDTDFPPLPEQPKKGKSNKKAKSSAVKPKPPCRPEDMTLDQLISSSLTLSARNNRNSSKSNKASKSTKHRPIKIQL